jgi:deoxyribonuclease-4
MVEGKNSRKNNITRFLQQVTLSFKIGFHVSISGGIHNSVTNAVDIGCTAFQIFTRSPRKWDSMDLEVADVDLFKANLKNSGIEKSSVAVHMPHLPNLSGPDGELYEKSVNSFTNELIRTSKLGIEYLVIDLGSDRGLGKDSGIKQLIKSCQKAIDEFKSAYQKKLDVIILLQNGWEPRNNFGNRLEELREILDKLPTKGYGICLDTCHAFISGYDLRTSEKCNGFVDKLNDIVGLDTVKFIHLNDSKMDIGSRFDIHEHIGLGKIGIEGLKTIVNHKSLRDLPMVIQIPYMSIEDHSQKLKDVLKLRN